jgi:acetoin utilization protein AcuB
MANAGPTIESYMTRSPHTIGAEQTLERAHAVMRDLGVRHLPVLHGGKLVGMLTERDLRLVESLDGVNPALVTVSDAMTEDVYSVSPDALLADVASKLSTARLGSTVVMLDAKVIGIFTTVDACAVLAQKLR